MPRGRLWLFAFFAALFLTACRVVLETPVPPLPGPEVGAPTFTASPFTPTLTLTPTPSPTPAQTLLPTETPVVPEQGAYPAPLANGLLATPGTGVEGLSLLSTPTPAAPMLMVQSASPAFIPAFRYASLGCNWMGVAGQVFGAGGNPLPNLVVSASGNVAGQSVDALGFTGLVTDYGPGGYEIQLANRVAPAIFWIQVYDLQGAPLSEAQMFQMGDDCAKNLAIINFVATGYLDNRLYLPLVGR
ncbi:hypothetical protein SE15_09730 [Thermanaerothrix daxensis]|uniref:Uncharacterized protein n=1 Tax=Thermanaerothrix daxensis TaxID=869279 RepID=A0A0P6XGM9_9CHLR|nr:hypothetical protein [Thermanaerothrix daxensis]KPL82428.1 hypothetical protein SE15_09730 [Thermanaerothrix daxensis]